MAAPEPVINPQTDPFIQIIEAHRRARHWSFAELARRGGLTQPEVSRVINGVRMPTLRHVRGFAVAFAGAPNSTGSEPATPAEWVAMLVDLAEDARLSVRTKDRTTHDA
jgi:transcriptional regulator with XRE-family HTH domain